MLCISVGMAWMHADDGLRRAEGVRAMLRYVNLTSYTPSFKWSNNAFFTAFTIDTHSFISVSIDKR